MKNIREAFIKSSKELLSNGYNQDGHPKGRVQLSSVAFTVEDPLETKEIEGVQARGIPTICSQEYGEQYFLELMSPFAGCYEYTYGQRMARQVDYVVSLLTTYSNNAQLAIASPEDYKLQHKPCLQTVDFKRLPHNKLDMTLYFRSWDIFALPYNLIGFALFFEYMASRTKCDVNHMHCYSSGLNCRAEMKEMLEKIVRYLHVI